MERLPVMSPRSFSVREKEAMIVQFHLQWAELHEVLTSWDIARRPDMPGGRWDNIIPSMKDGAPHIRMIDMGSSKLLGDKLFERSLQDDRKDIEEYTQYFLNSR